MLYQYKFLGRKEAVYTTASFLFLVFMCTNIPLHAQKLYKAIKTQKDGEKNERIYIGDQEKYTDKHTGVTVTKTLIISEKNFNRYEMIDTVRIWNTRIPDYKENYYTNYEFGDSFLIFTSQRIGDDYEMNALANQLMYEDMEKIIDIYDLSRSMQFDVLDMHGKKEMEVMASFTSNNLTWEDIRTLPLRPFVKQDIDTLGTDSAEYLREIAMPMNYSEIYDSISNYGTYGTDSLKKVGIDPFVYLADLTRLMYMMPYFQKNINKPYVREEVINQMKKLYASRIVDFRKLTGYDLRNDRNFQNIIQKKTVTSYNKKYIDTLNTIESKYIDDTTGQMKIRLIPINPKGQVTVHFDQINIEALKAVALNIGYEMNKWVDVNWEKMYGKKEDYGDDGFEPPKE